MYFYNFLKNFIEVFETIINHICKKKVSSNKLMFFKLINTELVCFELCAVYNRFPEEEIIC